jgi:uncharacterized protein
MAPDGPSRRHGATGTRTGAAAQVAVTKMSDPTIELRVTPRRIGLVAGAAIAAAVLAGPIMSGGRALAAPIDDTTREHTISVAGEGHGFIVPDVADLRLGVVARGATVAAARADAASAMTAVIKALRDAGIAEADIQTTTFSLQPVYSDPNGGTPRITGFEIRNAVKATVRDLDKAGPAIDEALKAGATTFDSLDLRVSDETAAERRAREAAVADAKAKADVLAAAAGTRIVGVASISESVGQPPYPYRDFGVAAGAAKDSSTPVAPGTSDLVVSVAVVYVIE